MAIKSTTTVISTAGVHIVGSTATAVISNTAASLYDRVHVNLVNFSTSVPIILYGAQPTSGVTGFTLFASTRGAGGGGSLDSLVKLEVTEGDDLWAVCTAGTPSLGVIGQRQNGS